MTYSKIFFCTGLGILLYAEYFYFKYIYQHIPKGENITAKTFFNVATFCK